MHGGKTIVTNSNYDVYNVTSGDRMIVDDVADEVIKAMKLNNTKKMFKPVLHGVEWPGDVKKIALKIEKLKYLGFKPRL